MTPDENRAVVRRFYEEFLGKNNIGIVDELFTPDFQFHDAANPDPGGGAEGYKRRNTVFLTAFPDRVITTDQQVAEADCVATRSTLRATHTGDLPGIPATGRHVTITAIEISRLVDGRIAEKWENWDALGMLQQLGVSSTNWGTGS